jgi:hypothetical protein
VSILFLIVGIALLGAGLYIGHLTFRVRDRGDIVPGLFQSAALIIAGIIALAGFANQGEGRFFGFAVGAVLLVDAVVLLFWSSRRAT